MKRIVAGIVLVLSIALGACSAGSRLGKGRFRVVPIPVTAAVGVHRSDASSESPGVPLARTFER
jgi:hypothetical protein